MTEQPPTLRDLVNAALASGKTYDQLMKRAVDPVTGEKPSRGYLNRIAKGTVKQAPLPHDLRAIAAALDKPYETVRRAAITQWLPADDEIRDPEAIRDEVIGEARRLRDLADEALDRLGDNGDRRGSA